MKEKKKRKATNLSLNEAIKLRGIRDAQAMGYELSNLVEHILDKLHEAIVLKRKKKPGDYYQIGLFDRKIDEEDKTKDR